MQQILVRDRDKKEREADMKKIKYNPDKLTSFEKEWSVHKNCREWWYATGILFDEEDNMYSYQYTLLHLAFGPATPKVAMVALTDYRNNRHYYLQTMPGRHETLVVSENEATVIGVASAKKLDDCMNIYIKHKDFSMILEADYGKGPIWHCDNGKLQMGIPGEKNTTLYYSWTNMPTTGVLTLGGKDIKLTGKTWFDKQGGTYNMANMKCHWEWFSLRFFDDEEAMLFTFPQNDEPYYDGTFVCSDGSYHRLNNYQIESLSVVEYSGLKWSSGWKLHMEEKEKDYIIEPIQEGHMNFAYFEELCTIKNLAGEVVGYAFAELLPGVLNQDLLSGKSGNKGISMKNLFKRIEF